MVPPKPEGLPDVATDRALPQFHDDRLQIATDVLNTIQHPVIMVNADGFISHANWAAEGFFGASNAILTRHAIDRWVPFTSPLLMLIDHVRERGTPVNEYRVDLSSPKLGGDKLVDLYVAPMAGVADRGSVVVVFQLRTVADKIDRQLTHRAGARSVTGLAAMLAHEIKNPLAGIRGAAQLLESSIEPVDRTLTRLICEETDRIVALVDRMEIFSDERPIDRQPINIHSVLNHVKTAALAGFARGVKITENYDPSLPPVFANRDQLVQVFLNLVKNACEATTGKADGEIELSTAYRPGISLAVPGVREKVSLPLEFCVLDNGPGVPDELLPHLFDPFITTKTNGSGLGLPLVAKIIGAHGGIVECDRQGRRTTFRVLMPVFTEVGQMHRAFEQKSAGS